MKGYASDSTLALSSFQKVQKTKSSDTLINKNGEKENLHECVPGKDLKILPTEKPVADVFMVSSKLARRNAIRRERERLYQTRVAVTTELTISHKPLRQKSVHTKLHSNSKDHRISRSSTIKKSKQDSFKTKNHLTHQVSIRVKSGRSDSHGLSNRDTLLHSYCIDDTKCLFYRLHGLNRCHSFSSLSGIGDSAAPVPSPPPGMKWVVYGYV